MQPTTPQFSQYLKSIKNLIINDTVVSGCPSKAKTLHHDLFITTPHFCQEQNE